jgi:hypothetical protein
MIGPMRWFLALLVRLVRAPAVRRRLLPLLHPGRTVDDNGRVYRERWTVRPPALGDQCVPGCTDPEVDWDGSHYCKVVMGRIDDLPTTYHRDTHGVVVEVTQTQGEPREVWVIPLDGRGGYAGDGWRITPAAAASLGELLDTAFVVAGRRAPGGVAHHRPGDDAGRERASAP